jgi:hypothetical protein
MSSAEDCRAGVDVGLTIEDGGIRSFHLAIGEHYRVPEKEIIVVKKSKLSDEELPVLYFLARASGVAPEKIIKLRVQGKSWMEISLHFGHSAEVFYVPITKAAGPPYGKAHGHYKNKAAWKKLRLTDDEIVNYVNLRFLSDHYGYSPDEIVEMRGKGDSFVAINGKVKNKKSGKSGKVTKKYAADEDHEAPTKAHKKGKKKNK